MPITDDAAAIAAATLTAATVAMLAAEMKGVEQTEAAIKKVQAIYADHLAAAKASGQPRQQGSIAFSDPDF